MTLTLTAGQTGAGVDGCMSGALNCVRAEERAEFVTVSDYESGGGRAEGAPEGPNRMSPSIGADDKNRDFVGV